MKISSLKIRVLLWFGSIVVIVLVLSSFAFYYFFKQSTELKLQTKLYEQAEALEESILSGHSVSRIFEKTSYKDLEIAVIKDGKTVAKNSDFKEDYSKYFSVKKDNFFLVESEQYIKGIYILILKKPFKGKLFVATKNLNNSVEDVEDTLLMIEPLLLLILLFLGNKMIDKILKPIEKITQSAHQITVNNFESTIPVPKEDDEIRALVLSFNKMILRLKEGIESLDRFNSDVSHELKTPITVIKGEIEVLLRKPRETKEYINTLKVIDYEASQLEQIVQNLLFLTKYSKENISKTFIDCHLDALLLNTLAKYEKEIEEKNILVHIEKLESVILKSNQQLITSIFSNLIDNAIKYTPNNKNIFIKLYKNKNRTSFIIEDEGIGIPKEEISKITEKFYRIDTSRNKKIKGFGLGLAIVKKSVELLDGKLQINSSVGKWTEVSISFNFDSMKSSIS